MKKIILAFVLTAFMSGAAFAQHPDGWGVGAGFQFGNHWDSYRGSHTGLTFFLKAPQIPIYWGISADIFDWRFGSNESYFGFSVTGDYFIIHQPLAQDIELSWFLGLGAYFGFWRNSWSTPDRSANFIDAGVRVPIGLSFMPLDFLEVFLSFAPSVGFYFHHRSYGRNDTGLGGGWQGDIGVRFWF